MSIWAIADLHLSFGVPNKGMDIFGEHWKNHPDKIAHEWLKVIKPDDLVLIAGDISWALHLEDALKDLEWIDRLPGTKLIIRGNHDLWWSSLSKLQQILPPSIKAIHNNAFYWNDWGIAGSRLWDSQEYSFDLPGEIKERKPLNEKPAASAEEIQNSEKIFTRELGRLEQSLKCLKPHVKKRIAMTHYPPISWALTPSKASTLLEKYGVQICVFGHLHHVPSTMPTFGNARGIEYLLTACDYRDFKPVLIE